MDSLPGTFYGNVDLHLSPRTERPEEREEAEYQERLYEKMHEEIAAGIAGYNEEDDSFIFSTDLRKTAQTKRSSFNNDNKFGNTRYIGPVDDFNQRDKVLEGISHNGLEENKTKNLHEYYKTDMTIFEQLKLTLDVRTREVHQKTEELKLAKLEYSNTIEHLQFQIDFLKSELNESKKSIAHQNEKLSEQELTINTQSTKLNELEHENEKLNTDLQVAHLTVRDLNKKIAILEKTSNEVLNLSKLEKQMQHKQELHREEILRLETELQLSCKKSQQLEKENIDLESRIRELHRLQNELQQEKLAMTKEIEKVKENILTSPVTELKSEVDVLKSRLHGLTVEAEKLRQNCDAKDDIIEQLNALKNISNNSQPVQMLQKELEKSYDEVKRLKQEKSLSMMDLKTKDMAVAAFTETISTLKKTMEEKKVQFNEISEKLKGVLAEKTELNVKYSNQSREFSDLESEYKKLKLRVEFLEDTNTKLQTAIEETAGMIPVDKYTEEYTRYLDEKVAAARNEVKESTDREIAEKDKEIERLKKENEDVKNLYLEAKEKSVIHVDVQKIQKELEDSRQRIIDYKASFSEKIAVEIKERDNQIEKLKNDKEHLEQKLTDLTRDYRIMCDRTDEKVKRVMELQEEVDNCKKHFSRTKEEIVEKYEIEIREFKERLQANAMKQTKGIENEKESIGCNTEPGIVCISERELTEKMQLLAEIHERELQQLAQQFLRKNDHISRSTMTEPIDLASHIGKSISESELQRFIEITRNYYVETIEQLRKDHNGQIDRMLAAQQHEIIRLREDHEEHLKRMKTEMEVEFEKRLQKQEEQSKIKFERMEKDYEKLNTKARDYKVYYNKVLMKILEEKREDKDHYDKMLVEVHRDVQTLLHPNMGDLNNRLKNLVKKYDDKINSICDRNIGSIRSFTGTPSCDLP